jgi:hypothetical protein
LGRSRVLTHGNIQIEGIEVQSNGGDFFAY